MEDKLHKLIEQIGDGFAHLNKKMDDGFAEVNERLDHLDGQVTDIRTDILEIRRDLRQLREDVNRIDERLRNMEVNSAGTIKEIDELKARMRVLEKQISLHK
jgi:chromosome segregation ATPase